MAVFRYYNVGKFLNVISIKNILATFIEFCEDKKLCRDKGL